jgi:hypothetical protein
VGAAVLMRRVIADTNAPPINLMAVVPARADDYVVVS